MQGDPGDSWQSFLENLAQDREWSAVSGDTFRRIHEIIAAVVPAGGDGTVPNGVVIDALLAGLNGAELREIVTDWARLQAAL